MNKESSFINNNEDRKMMNENLKHTYLLTVNGEKIKLCLYQDKDEISLEVEDDEDRDIDLEQIT